MKASVLGKTTGFEFRFRYLIHALVYVLGFTTPWNKWLHLDTVRTWQWLAAMLTRHWWMSFSASTIAVLVAGIVLAGAGAGLRTWGAAYLGAGIVQDSSMHGERMIAAGPYRYMRNPLYLGTFLHTLALSLLMLPSGAVFTIALIGLLQLRLIFGEEAFLGEKLGEPYRAYCAAVPRIVPAMRARVAESAARPALGLGFMGEIYMWGVVVSFAALGWRYNSFLIIQGVVVSWGLSLVTRAFVPKPAVD
jgi:protein-S-isoprenylcysteine O-methyltransferase Ste14